VIVGGRRALELVDPLGIAPPTIVPPTIVRLLGQLDGTRSLAELAARPATPSQPLSRRELEEILDLLGSRLLLDDERFGQAVAAELDRRLDQGFRPAQHAGTAGYSCDAEDLREALTRLVGTDVKRASAAPRGIVAPHLDLDRGRAGYRAAYRRLLAAPPADLYVVLGTGHEGPMAPVTGWPVDWQTPLGTVMTDRAFVQNVHARIGEPDPHDILLHQPEHSIELQVVMLQHVAEQRGHKAPKVAGFLCGNLPSTNGDPTKEAYLQQLLAAFRHAEREHGGSICYVAGADLAHVGPLFGDERPVNETRLRELDAMDRSRLALLTRSAPGAFHQAVALQDNPDRVCSAPAITLTALLAGGPAELLHYGQACADDGHQTVSFCAMQFAGQDR
jgi:AmmeMemoRadiSam system protein B